jgi:hypothetical protein
MPDEALKPRRVKRETSLGVNFEHGINGAVVVFVNNEEVVMAMIPENCSVDSKQATALAARYRDKGNQIVTVDESSRILKKLEKKPVARKAKQV